MTTVQKISLTSAEMKQNRIDTLGYAVNNEHGYLKDLNEFDLTKGAIVEEFVTAGFIKTGYTRTKRTFGITKLGKQYFEEIQWGKLLKRALECK